MTTKYFIYPYSQFSAGSIVLSEELDAKRIKLTNSNYSHKPENVLINWGNGNCPYPQALNPAAAILEVINKVDFFKKLEGTGTTPKFATTKTAAANLKFPVVCRKTVEGHDGDGIVIADTAAQLVQAALYTEYVDKTSEYRIHIGRLPNGELTVIARQKKSKTDAFTGDARVWTGPETKLDWIDTAVPEVVYVAKKAFEQFPKLTFGAFDIVYDNSTEKAYVLEINSAPMMTQATVEAYAEFFRKFTGTASAAPAQQPAATQETAPVQTQTPTPTQTAPAGIYAFVKAQIAAGHISKAAVEAATPKPTEEQLIQNYVNSITA